MRIIELLNFSLLLYKIVPVHIEYSNFGTVLIPYKQLSRLFTKNGKYFFYKDFLSKEG